MSVEVLKDKGRQEVEHAYEKVASGIPASDILITKLGVSYILGVSHHTLKDWRLKKPPYGPAIVPPPSNNYMDNSRIAKKYRFSEVLSFAKARSSNPEVRTMIEEEMALADKAAELELELLLIDMRKKIADLKAKHKRAHNGNAKPEDLVTAMGFLISNEQILAPFWDATEEEWEKADDFEELEPVEAMECPWVFSERREGFHEVMRSVVEQVSSTMERLALLAKATKVETKRAERF